MLSAGQDCGKVRSIVVGAGSHIRGAVNLYFFRVFRTRFARGLAKSDCPKTKGLVVLTGSTERINARRFLYAGRLKLKTRNDTPTSVAHQADERVLTLSLYVAAAGVLLLGTTLLLAQVASPVAPRPLLNMAALPSTAPTSDIATTDSMLSEPEVEIAAEPIITGIKESPLESGPSDIRYFDGRAIRPTKTMSMIVTAYSPDARSCAPFDDGYTASGYSVQTNGGALIAADKRFKFGSLMSVPGYNGNRPTPVLDRGGAIKGNRLDVLYPTHEIARKWGRRRVEVIIWEYVDDELARR